MDKTMFDGKALESAGRKWKIQELRRKSFEDLHKLYFSLYKERNMLLSHQRVAEMMRGSMKHPERLVKVRKSLARIKRVLSERTTAASNAAKQEFEQKKAQNVYKWPIEQMPETELVKQVLFNKQ